MELMEEFELLESVTLIINRDLLPLHRRVTSLLVEKLGLETFTADVVIAGAMCLILTGVFYAILSLFIGRGDFSKDEEVKEPGDDDIVKNELKDEGGGVSSGQSSNEQLMGHTRGGSTTSNGALRSTLTTHGLPPKNFIDEYKGNIAKATAAYEKATAWRKENNMDNVFQIPQPSFHSILKYYPHAIHGKAYDGSIVLYEILGKARMKELSRVGVSVENMVEHINLRNEFCFHRFHKSRLNEPFDPRSISRVVEDELNPLYMHDEGVKIMTVLDVGGIKLSDVTKEVLMFIKQSSNVVDRYYPNRVVRLAIVNAPSWFGAIWSMISNILPESVKKKINIMGNVSGLDKIIDPTERPVEYGGIDEQGLGDHWGMKDFLSIAESWQTAKESNFKSGDGMLSFDDISCLDRTLTRDNVLTYVIYLNANMDLLTDKEIEEINTQITMMNGKLGSNVSSVIESSCDKRRKMDAKSKRDKVSSCVVKNCVLS